MLTCTTASAGRKALSSMCRSCRHAKIQRESRRTFSSTAERKATNPLAGLGESLQNDEAARPSAQRSRTSSLFERLGIPNQQRTPERNGQPPPSNPFRKQHPPQPLAPAPAPAPAPESPPASAPAAQQVPSDTTTAFRPQASAEIASLFKSARDESQTRTGTGIPPDEPYHLHVYSHKHNCHITFTEPSRNVILCFSCGNIGLRKAQRQSFDASYQLSTYAMKKIAMASWRIGGKKMPQAQNPMKTVRDVHAIEVVMRGFGPGREAFQKALLGSEGHLIRPLVKRVSDATRLKFGGARSPAVRRLG